MHELLEREDKWDVNDRFVLPRLHDLIDGGEIDRSTVHLQSEYDDTADHDLQSHGIVLRRRDGDDDTGWQLKVPDSEGRIEIRTTLADAPPAELEELLTGLRLGKELVNVATIRTERTRYRIREPEHQRVCAEVADDQVHASVEHRLLAWREVEVEFGSDARPLARRLAKRLSKAGARPSRYPSKLAHALPAAETSEIEDTALGGLTTYVAEQIDAIFDGDMRLRRGQDPIHDTRVAIRRLRSTIRVFGKLFDRSATDHLDEELKWFAGLLGEVRDRQVQPTRWTRRGIWTFSRRCSDGVPSCRSPPSPPPGSCTSGRAGQNARPIGASPRRSKPAMTPCCTVPVRRPSAHAMPPNYAAH